MVRKPSLAKTHWQCNNAKYSENSSVENCLSASLPAHSLNQFFCNILARWPTQLYRTRLESWLSDKGRELFDNGLWYLDKPIGNTKKLKFSSSERIF